MSDNPLKPNFLQFPNILVDSLMKHLTPVEFLCLVVIVRKTVGWHKSEDPISLSQFLELTGVRSKKTIMRALNRLTHPGVGLIGAAKCPRKTTVYSLGPVFYGNKDTSATMAKITTELGAQNTPVSKLSMVKTTTTIDIPLKKKEREKHREAVQCKTNKENGRQAAEVCALARDRQDLMERGALCGLLEDPTESAASFEKRLLAVELMGALYENLQGK